MAGPKSLRIQKGGGVRGRNAEYAGAPIHVSDNANTSRNITTPKNVPEFDFGNQTRMVLADRPSTSGGTSNRKPVHRQETKDDLHCSPSRAHHFNTTYYNFPLPASILTPAASPNNSPPGRLSPKFSEQDDIGPSHPLAHEEIGMALGSPTHHTAIWPHEPVIWSPHVQFRSPMRRDSPESLEDWMATSPPKSKSSKWKILGGFFGKKASEPAQAFYQVQAEVQTVQKPDYLTFPPPPPEKPRRRGRTTSERNIEKHKPDIKRANTVPLDFQFPETSNSPPKEFPLHPPAAPPKIQLDGGPLLNVDIPNIEMERYSVMFGNVIKPNASTSSLLARRQATLDKLKVVNEAIAEHERQQAEAKSKLLRPRRATSPQPTKSPALSLFPTQSGTQRDGYVPRRASPLHRSNTSPAALSPNRQTFQIPRLVNEENPLPLAPSPANLQPTATLSSPWSADDSFLSMDSPTSAISEEEEQDGLAPLKPRLKEPVWEMVTPPTMPSNSQRSKSVKLAAVPEAAPPYHPRKQSLQSSLDHLARSRTIEGPPLPRKQSLQSSLDHLARAGAVDEAEEMIKSAADISIARQISVSRRQRQLLVAVKSRPTAAAGASRVPSPGVAQERAAGEDRVIVNDRKPMTPTVVNVKARRAVKSEIAVLEGA